jgi:hypothetical protein
MKVTLRSGFSRSSAQNPLTKPGFFFTPTRFGKQQLLLLPHRCVHSPGPSYGEHSPSLEDIDCQILAAHVQQAPVSIA